MIRFLLTWAAAFTSVFAIFLVFGGVLTPLPLWLRALVVSGLMVAAMQFLLGPPIARLVARFG